MNLERKIGLGAVVSFLALSACRTDGASQDTYLVDDTAADVRVCDQAALVDPVLEGDALVAELDAFDSGVNNMAYVIGVGLNTDVGTVVADGTVFGYREAGSDELYATNLGFGDVDAANLTPVVMRSNALGYDFVATQCYHDDSDNRYDTLIECHMANLFDDQDPDADYTVGGLRTPLWVTGESVLLGDYINMTNESSATAVDAAPSRVYITDSDVCRVQADQTIFETCDPLCMDTVDDAVRWLTNEGGQTYLMRN